MAKIRNVTQGPKGAYVKEEGAAHALKEEWAGPGEVIEADDYNPEWFELVGDDAAPAAKAEDGEDGAVSDDLIVAAIEELDPYNDDHWTAKGAPQVDAVSDILEAKVTRADINRAAPDKSRPSIGD